MRELIHIHTAYIAIVIAGLKAIAFCHVQCHVQTLSSARSKRHILLCRHLLAVDTAELADIFQHLVFMRVYPRADFLFIHNKFPLNYFVISANV